jgi:uncharacterized membrane protein/nitrite reductase/ring-hydroxylating ferredoxin subunit
MRSRAHIKTHPLHPALIPFPFAFLVGAALFDAVAVVTSRAAFGATAGHLTIAGLAAGLLAAVPGVIDYIYTVPPNSSGKERATKHAIGNVTALVLFGASWWMRADDGTATTTTLVLEFVGLLLLGYSGWLGGVLVTRNLISVDHRYANKGKWQEASFTAPAGKPLVVGAKDELLAGHMKLLRVNGRRLVLARTADGYIVFDDGCTHRGGSLAGGVLIGHTVQCLWHGSQFDCRTGAVVCGPAKKQIQSYEVREEGGRLILSSPPH